MKKLLILSFIITIGLAFSQKKNPVVKKTSEIEMAQQKAKQYFEENLVKNFKDPYSYELKKIWTEENTVYKNNVRMIGELERFNKKEWAKKRQDSLKNVIDLFTDADKLKVESYIVHIDAYGANSYGNKILGRYKIEVSPGGKILGHTNE